MLRKQQLHNSNVCVQYNELAQFNISGMTFQENPTYRDVSSTIDKLNLMLTYQEPKQLYHGQPIHRLAHEYYERNYNKDYTSQMTSKFQKSLTVNVVRLQVLISPQRTKKQHMLMTLINVMLMY